MVICSDKWSSTKAQDQHQWFPADPAVARETPHSVKRKEERRRIHIQVMGELMGK